MQLHVELYSAFTDLLDENMPGKVLVFIERIIDVDNLFEIVAKENEEETHSWTVGYLHSHCTVKFIKFNYGVTQSCPEGKNNIIKTINNC